MVMSRATNQERLPRRQFFHLISGGRATGSPGREPVFNALDGCITSTRNLLIAVVAHRSVSSGAPILNNMIFDRVAIRKTYFGVFQRCGTPNAAGYIVVELNRIFVDQCSAKVTPSAIGERGGEERRRLGPAFKFAIFRFHVRTTRRQVKCRHSCEKGKITIF
jgi:hypothetical protein